MEPRRGHLRIRRRGAGMLPLARDSPRHRQPPWPRPGSASHHPLLKAAATNYPDAMEKLPAEYEHYLVGKDELHIETVMPIFRESIAEGKYGVHIRGLGGHSEQAFVDETVPFGKIKITVP